VRAVGSRGEKEQNGGMVPEKEHNIKRESVGRPTGYKKTPLEGRKSTLGKTKGKIINWAERIKEKPRKS